MANIEDAAGGMETKSLHEPTTILHEHTTIFINIQDTRNLIIYKVPNKLREIRPAAYTPQLVSIGPFHYGNSNLKATESYKTKYMDNFLGRAFCNHIKEADLIRFMQDRDRLLRIQLSYAVTFEFEAENRSHIYIMRTSLLDKADEENRRLNMDFIRMIARDACFIFELFFRNHEFQIQPHDEEGKNQLAEKIKNYLEGDDIFKSPWVKAAVKQDLIMLENQLPFFVLTQLFDFIFTHPRININAIPDYLPELKNNEDEPGDFLIQITCEFFIDYYWFGKPRPEETWQKKQPLSSADSEGSQNTSSTNSQHTTLCGTHISGSIQCTNSQDTALCGTHIRGSLQCVLGACKNLPQEAPLSPSIILSQLVSEMKQNINAFKQMKHFTDLVRMFMHDEEKKFPNSSYYSTRCLYSAKQLDNAGLMFGCPEDSKYLADIETGGDKRGCWMPIDIDCLELKVPQLKVQDNTECIFRNVMALEQFVYPDKPYICNYIFLLDQLINTFEDVDLLVDKKIIDNWLGSNDAVVVLVNTLCDQIVTPRFFYTDICKKLNRYHSKRLNVARSTLKRVYFKDIWTGSSTVVGLVFLIFSLFSTYSTIKTLFSESPSMK